MTEGLTQRIKTAFIIGLPILFLVFYSDATRVLFLSLLILLTAWEFLTLHYKSVSNKALYFVISLSLTIGISSAAIFDLLPQSLIFLALVPTTLLSLDLFKNFISRTHSNAWLYSLVYATIPLVSLLVMHDKPYFKALLIGCLLLIWVSDIAAYFVGKSIGKHKLMPSVSPGKTREGFFGAGMITILCSYLAYNFLGHFSLQQWVIIALLVWLFGSIGDLIESKMKRQLKIKDSGNILPGHGGFLDRFDGFIFCLPPVCTFVYLITSI